MKKKIIHTLVYNYEIPVSLEEHLICLKPRSNSFQELSNFDLQIFPSPYSIFPLLSDNGDDIFKAVFTGSTNSLKIKTESYIETKIHPDLYQLKNDYDLSLPMKIESNNSLIGFIKGWFPNGQHDPAAIRIAQEALTGINNNVFDFLYQLIELIKDGLHEAIDSLQIDLNKLHNLIHGIYFINDKRFDIES